MTFRSFYRRLHFNERREFSYFAQFYHVINFRVERPGMKLEKGMLIISIDIDAGSPELGILNGGKNDANVAFHLSENQIGKIEEEALPMFLSLFDLFGIPATFAIRGQLIEVSNEMLLGILNSHVQHDLGGHGYSHKEFTKLSRSEAEKELSMLSIGLKNLGISPESFIFPRNSVAHLDLLHKFGYKCYRSRGGFMTDRMFIEKQGEMYDVHPSLYVDENTQLVFLKKMLDISVTKKLPFHIWFHLWNFGETRKSIQKNVNRILVPFFEYAKEREKSGTLTFETMQSAVDKSRQKLEQCFLARDDRGLEV
jgi:peptidoglycan/xylan/chitin deacetylase (PgdA/CDA1 family)